jgi:hypothetical protein
VGRGWWSCGFGDVGTINLNRSALCTTSTSTSTSTSLTSKIVQKHSTLRKRETPRTKAASGCRLNYGAFWRNSKQPNVVQLDSQRYAFSLPPIHDSGHTMTFYGAKVHPTKFGFGKDSCGSTSSSSVASQAVHLGLAAVADSGCIHRGLSHFACVGCPQYD